MPEVDSPGHNNAIIMSEYNDKSNPLLNRHPQDINCSANKPPVWNFTGDVGYSAMCPDSQNSFTIYNAIITQLAAMSTSPGIVPTLTRSATTLVAVTPAPPATVARRPPW